MHAPRVLIAASAGILLATALSASSIAAVPAPANTPASSYALLVVLDASGSMKQSVPGGVKRDLATRGLLRLLATLPDDSVSALRLLGEGTTDDECAASRVAVPFAPFDHGVWSGALGRIRWDGATPLSYTIRQALSDLTGVEASRKEILLIGDGEETCGEDPVGVARELANGVRIHTMSLGERVSHQLAGIALVTGGTYTRAFDDTTFAAAAVDSLPGTDSVTPPAGAGGQASTLHVILDVSNSMWGQVEGRAKIELAREALRSSLSDLPADVRVGLRAYGHRVSYEDKETGCADTELLVAPAAGAGPEIIAQADGLTPRGQTPIALSLRQASTDLDAAGGSGVLLLISDGLESCGGDPLAAAAELRAAGKSVVLHTVGLGVSSEEAAALAAIAQAGGGQYFDAPTPQQLVSSVDMAVRTTREFILQADEVSSFPSSIERVRGGDTVQEAELLGPGTYSFSEHLFRTRRFFAVAGQPGDRFVLAGLVCALALGRNADGEPAYRGATGMMFGRRVDANGERLRGRGLTVRGDMGDWVEMPFVIGDDGTARFWLGRPFDNVHRDMVFEIRPQE